MKILSQFACLLLFVFTIGCTSPQGPITETVVMDGVTIPEGFTIETLYKPQDHEQGSWVSVTKDDKGKLYTSDQYGNLYRVTLPAIGSKDSVTVEKMDLNIGLAQGLLWHEGVLFALVNSNEREEINIKSGFYKITDTSGDGNFDTVNLIRPFDGDGEHGPHNIILSPDKKSLYLVLGNHTDIPEDLGSVVPKVWDEDNLLPVIKDPSGHANSRKAPGGWVVKTDFEGKEWTITNVGLRNTYDIAFNRNGDLFGFDSDMEYDIGMPWYRPIRLCHMISGAEFGWRTGTGKFTADYPDNMPGIANLGQGSPTGLMNGHGLKFPEYYQDGMYLFDWSYGTMYYAKLTPSGSSYSTEVTEFLSGVPLPLTNGIAGDDGALYFLTGGRRLSSALYRVTYNGERGADIIEMTENSPEKSTRQLRRKLEALQSKDAGDQIDFMLSNLDHKDRSIRYVARIALENQAYSLWKDAINNVTSPESKAQISLSIARHGSEEDRINALNILAKLDWTSFAESKKIDYIRSIDLLLTRSEDIPLGVKKALVDSMLPRYLSESQTLNKELCKILSYLQVSEIIAPTLEKMETDTIVTDDQKSIYLSSSVSARSDQYGKDVERMLANMPNQQNISYAKSLSAIKNGWTKELNEKYFNWYNRALKRSGGKQYAGFIRAIQQLALNNVDEADRQYYEAMAGEGLKGHSSYMANVTQPKGPGKSWTKESVLTSYGNEIKPNFESGKNLYRASLCISCHSISGEGGSAGPELTRVGTRFSVGDLAEAIIDPSATVSDRYRNTKYFMKDGNEITGRQIEENERNITISTNPFSPDLTTPIRISNIVNMEESPYSPMPAGLMNRLNDQEMNDLIAYLLAGGSQDAEVYK